MINAFYLVISLENLKESILADLNKLYAFIILPSEIDIEP
jgi:hypothetical protein